MPNKTTKTTTRGDAKERREGAMMSKLCKEHGYAFIANKPGRRLTMMLDRGSKRVVAMYTMQLAVPAESALGKQMIAHHPPPSSPDQGTRPKRRGRTP